MSLVQVAVLGFALSIVAAHLLGPAGYVWTRDTVSRLAQRGHRHFWVLRAGMIGYGALIAAATIWREPPALLIGLYGLGVFLAGAVPVAPPDTTDKTALRMERIHNWSIYLAGTCLVASITWHLVHATGWSQILLHATPLALVVTLELCFNLPDHWAISRWRGLLQRGLHASTLAWLALTQ